MSFIGRREKISIADINRLKLHDSAAGFLESDADGNITSDSIAISDITALQTALDAKLDDSQLETAITDSDTKIPTSGATIDLLNSNLQAITSAAIGQTLPPETPLATTVEYLVSYLEAVNLMIPNINYTTNYVNYLYFI